MKARFLTIALSCLLTGAHGATFSAAGTYVLRLTASDGTLAATDNWTESTVSGSSAPEKAGEIGCSTGDITNGRVIASDVSAAVGGPGIYSFILEADPSPLDVSFASPENSSLTARPSLEVSTATSGTSNRLSAP